MEDGTFAPVSRIEYAVKRLVREGCASGKKAPCYVYRFDVDIPGEDDPGNFHSSDLWFFFDNLQACWRPFTGRHYDIARTMADAWACFIRTGSPNGTDRCGQVLPEWKPYVPETEETMTYTPAGARVEKGDTPFLRFLISHTK